MQEIKKFNFKMPRMRVSSKEKFHLKSILYKLIIYNIVKAQSAIVTALAPAILPNNPSTAPSTMEGLVPSPGLFLAPGSILGTGSVLAAL